MVFWLIGIAQGAFAADLHHTVRAGDTLTGLAGQLLENPADWRKVQRANGMPDGNRIRANREIVIPGRLLKGQTVAAQVVSATGSVSRSGEVLKEGAEVREGDHLATGPDGFVTLRLADGSILVLQPRTRAGMQSLRYNSDAARAETAVKLDSGRVESKVVPQQQGPAPRFRIHTPSATVGVRGTSFRVAVDEQRDARAEVTKGVVRAGRDGGEYLDLPRGYGVAVRQGQPLGKAVRLALAPDLSVLPPVVERVAARLPLPAITGAVAYRVQVARDEAFERVEAESLVQQPEVRTGDLPDGDYWVRVRAVDAVGLEGLDAARKLAVRARPEPPLAQLPARSAILSVDEVHFAWAEVDGSAAYRLQVARDAGFAQVVVEEKRIAGTQFVLPAPLERGKYFWRLSSVRGDDYSGPWGDAQSFELRAVQKGPEAPRVGEETLQFSWPGSPGQQFDFQLAKDRSFAQLLVDRRLEGPAIELPRPEAGTYYIRLRPRDEDGYVAPYTAPQKVEVPPPPPYWLLMLLVPALL